MVVEVPYPSEYTPPVEDVMQVLSQVEYIGSHRGKLKKILDSRRVDGGFLKTGKFSLNSPPYDFLRVYIPQNADFGLKIGDDIEPVDSLVELWTREFLIAKVRRVRFGFTTVNVGEVDKTTIVKIVEGKFHPINEEDFTILQDALKHVDGKVRKDYLINYGILDKTIPRSEQLRS